LVWTKTLSPGDGSGFISDNGLNDFFVPRVNADVINTGLFSYLELQIMILTHDLGLLVR
jgi:hypothetical protein